MSTHPLRRSTPHATVTSVCEMSSIATEHGQTLLPTATKSTVDSNRLSAGTAFPASTDQRASQPSQSARSNANDLGGRLAEVDVDRLPLTAFLTRGLLNNVGTPTDDGTYACHTKPTEREVVRTFATLFRAPAENRGHVADEATLWFRLQSCNLYPHAVVYRSQAVHPCSVPKAAWLLGVPTVEVRADGSGEVDYDDLQLQVAGHPGQAAAVVANVGTNMTEAHDGVRRIAGIVDGRAVAGRWIHADVALSGIPLALVDPALRPGPDFADSMVVSGQELLGTLQACAVVLASSTPDVPLGDLVLYLDTHDEAIAGSRDGHASLMLWWMVHTLGLEGVRQRAEKSRAMAMHTLKRLETLGWTAFRNPNAFTVVLKEPSFEVARRWTLPTEDGWSHIICMPGVTIEQIALISDLETALGHGTRATVRTLAPRQDRRPAGTSEAATA